ncbi:Ste23 protein [Candida orthopsilosis Co 90-125]|uniref:Ste23 protein n=1 Tax=Candida orthopsilosis (strain 90-125) TaxID=1136231 RepID=H8XB74_CANO9|nr:Ste23 protein [Candida orthopsilosis Co 90-125]CCG25323.1 Ste23 protein [Candida orthopsilosis Co 90-125]
MSLFSTQDQSVFTELVSSIQHEQDDRELHWLVSSVILPEFPQIIEALTICSNMLMFNSPQQPDPSNKIQKGPAIKLPVSSGTQDNLKGIIVRDGAFITEFTVSVKDHYLNKVFHKLKLKKPVLLEQVVNANSAIDAAIMLINQLSEFTDVEELDHDATHKKLIDVFQRLLSSIQTAKTNLQLPTDPALVFPERVTRGQTFEPELPDTIPIDFYLNQAEICVDIKSLSRVTEKPWGDIDPRSGQSYVDKVRDQMKLPPSSANSIRGSGQKVSSSEVSSIASATPSVHMGKDENVGNSFPDQDTSEKRDTSSFFNNMMSHISLKPKHDAQDYITRCITYNKMVVMIKTKIEVSSEDPILVSCFTKLDSIEYLITNFLHSLSNLVG